MRLIEEGHYLLPWFSHPEGEVPADPEAFLRRYYQGPMEKARRMNLPVTLLGSQWESGLSREPYLSLPPDQNPNVVTVDGTISKAVCPFGPIVPWREIGRKHTDNSWMKQLQQWYPDPPLVIFLSNNEHSKLRWKEVEKSKRYLDMYGPGHDGDFNRKAVADGWIERYRGLQDGLRDGLDNATWKKNAVFVGYDAFGPPHLGRMEGWIEYSLYSKGRIDPYPLMWDGGSPSYYTDDWTAKTDYIVMSPQVEFMNLVFMQQEALKLNRRFWFEFSVWDGYHADPKRQKTYPSKRSVYRQAGQVYNPERYGGFMQFGLWLMRPRAVREYLGWTEPWDDVTGQDGQPTHEGGGPYFMALVKAVDRVHVNPVLRQWWRKGDLVPNRARPHPYQAGIPAEYQQVDRWFRLDTSLDPPPPWKLTDDLRVFSLALVQGKAPNRQWLVYAHSPLADRKAVGVTIPDYKRITIDISVAGTFYQVAETTGTVEPL